MRRLCVFVLLVLWPQIIIRNSQDPDNLRLNPIAASRLPTTDTGLPNSVWAAAGTTITHRTTECDAAACVTLASAGTGATGAQINSAIAAADAEDVITLACGTYTLSTGLLIARDNVTLRGCGPQGASNGGTTLDFNASPSTDCYGNVEAGVCIRGTINWHPTALDNQATLSGTFTKGQTTLTFSTVTNLSVGAIVLLDQQNDASDTGNIYVCTQFPCSDEGGGSHSFGEDGDGLGTHAQQQWVEVTAVNGSNVTFTPGLLMPNWRSGQSPRAFWGDGTGDAVGVGIEDLFIEADAANIGGIGFAHTRNSWVARVGIYGPGQSGNSAARAHVSIWYSRAIEVRDSYFDECSPRPSCHASQSYGIEVFHVTQGLFENNIFHHITAPIMFNGSGSGSVAAYNYTLDNTYNPSPSFMIAGLTLHEGGIDTILFEGNDTNMFQGDDIHGTSQFVTVFRNRIIGRESGDSSETNPVSLYSYQRYMNLVGNVLGDNAYHTSYAAQSDVAIYRTGQSPRTTTPPSPAVPADSYTTTSMYRWGNYDTVTDAVRWESSEVPTGLTDGFAQSVPSTQTLPASLYLTSKPTFFGSSTWPGIGPDVTGGDISSVGGTAFKNPARLCYENTSKDGNGRLTNFNPDTCY